VHADHLFHVGGECSDLCLGVFVFVRFVLVVVVWKVEGGRVRNIGVCSFS
jgi:hypothetical protein